MSERTPSGFTTPLQTMFEMQRNVIDAGQQMLEGTKSMQRIATDGMVTGLRLQEATQRQTLEFSRAVTQNYLETLKATMPGGEREVEGIQREVDAGFADLEELHGEAYDDLEANVAEFGRLSEEYVTALQEGTATTVETQRRVERGAVRSAAEGGRAAERTLSRTVEATERATEAATNATQVAIEETTDATRATLDQRVDGVGSARADRLAEASIESLQDLAEAQAETVAEAADVSTDLAQEWIDRAGATYGRDVTLVDGIGEAHAADLHGGGIETVADLAEADATRVATIAGVSEEHAQEWIDEAQRHREEGLEAIDGIGESRAERLRAAGIETIADLAASDEHRVADAADVSEEQAGEWIDAARA